MSCPTRPPSLYSSDDPKSVRRALFPADRAQIDSELLRLLIQVTAFQAKDGEFRGSTRDIEFPDGRKLSLGSSANNEEQQK